MMKKREELDVSLARRRPIATPEAAAKALERAAAELAARRARDALPVRIVTRRLVLRAPIRGDVPDLVRHADNPRIAAMLSRLPSPYTRADAIGFVEIMAQRADERPYAMTLGGQLIGIVGLTFQTDRPPELGYWLGEAHWGKGLMSEAMKAVLEAAFATGHFPLIRARALSENAASLRVLEKAGFRRMAEELGDCGVHKDRLIVLLEKEQPRWM
jgi:RimJ/RimL family protein N-acetyltransferase